MKPFDELAGELGPLLETLEPAKRKRLESHLKRVAAAISRMEADNSFLLRERSSIHALMKKTSDDLVQRYQRLFENVGIAMAVVEVDGTLSLVNSRFGQILGYSREEIEGKVNFLEFSVPEERERIRNYHIIRRMNQPVPDRYETRALRKDGEVIDVVYTVHLLPGTQQSIVSIRDITSQKRAETALRLANTKLNILANLSRHDILNQLTVLGNYIELSENMTKDPRILEYLKREAEVTDSITHIISFTKDYQELGVQSPVWQNLGETILRATRNLRTGDIGIHIHIREEIEVYADLLLERVFYNLMDNSLKYGKTLTSITFTFHEDGKRGVIVCEDDGVGIPSEEKENIFLQKYFKHTGLGMYLSREVLAITGITIKETGRPGNGARFEITVPETVWRYRGQPES